jgi:glutaredoxin-related protein
LAGLVDCPHEKGTLMIFWGSGHKAVQKKMDGAVHCPSCGSTNELAAVVDYDYHHLYGIFRSVKNVKSYIACQKCGNAREVENKKDLFEQIGGNPIPKFDRFGGAVLVALVAGFIGYAFMTGAQRGDDGSIDSGGRLDAFDVRLGDCFNDADSSMGEEISSLDAVPCGEPHDNEIYAVFNLETVEFPEGDAMSEIVGEECLSRFEGYVGREYETSVLEVSAMYPTHGSWHERGDREVACILYNMEYTKLVGSVRDSGI